MENAALLGPERPTAPGAPRPHDDVDTVRKPAKGSVTVLRQAAALEPGTLLAGRYQIQAEAGRGGMSIVYRALDKETGERVALKMLDASGADLEVKIEGFKRELRLVHRLNHPRIAKLYSYTPDPAGPGAFVTMRLVEGESLRQRLRRGPLSRGEARRVLLALADALAAVHREKIIHRDVTTGNVMIGRDGEPHLMDFGIALAPNEAPTRIGPAPVIRTRSGTAVPIASDDIAGTPGSMSPEAARGAPVDQRADVFQFGVLMVDVLGGRANPDEPPTPGDARALPWPFGSIAARCLALHPEDRPDSMAWVATRLRRPWARPAAIGALGTLAVLALVFAVTHRTVTHSVALGRFAVQGKDASSGRLEQTLLAGLLAGNLRQASNIEVVDADQLDERATAAGWQGAPRSREDDLQLARAAGAGTLLTGTVLNDPGGRAIVFQVDEVDTGRILSKGRVPIEGGTFTAGAERVAGAVKKAFGP